MTWKQKVPKGYMAAHANFYGADVRNPASQGKWDSNHAALSLVYEELYCSVVPTTGIGHGFPDAVVGIMGRTELVEFKTEDGELRPAQVTFHRDWRGSKVRTIRTRADVIAHVQEMAKR